MFKTSRRFLLQMMRLSNKYQWCHIATSVMSFWEAGNRVNTGWILVNWSVIFRRGHEGNANDSSWTAPSSVFCEQNQCNLHRAHAWVTLSYNGFLNFLFTCVSCLPFPLLITQNTIPFAAYAHRINPSDKGGLDCFKQYNPRGGGSLFGVLVFCVCMHRGGGLFC